MTHSETWLLDRVTFRIFSALTCRLMFTVKGCVQSFKKGFAGAQKINKALYSPVVLVLIGADRCCLCSLHLIFSTPSVSNASFNAAVHCKTCNVLFCTPRSDVFISDKHLGEKSMEGVNSLEKMMLRCLLPLGNTKTSLPSLIPLFGGSEFPEEWRHHKCF